jgi:hypothetical protein
MKDTLTFHEKPTHLHAIVTGANRAEVASAYLAELPAVCSARGRRRVLLEERLVGPPMPLIDVFEIVEAMARDAPAMFDRFAFVDVYPRGDNVKFAETVAVNRSIPVRTFATVAVAAAWPAEE